MIPPPLWNACDFVLQFIFTIAHVPGKMNSTADFLSCLEVDPNEKLILKIQEDVPTQTIEVNIQSTGLTQDDQVFYHRVHAELPSEEQLWQRKQKTLSDSYIDDKCTNTLMQTMETFNKVPSILL